LLPPTVGAGYANVFYGTTGDQGEYGISNTSAIHTIAKSWIAYQGKTLTAESSPNILVYVTYHSTNGIYFKQTSIELTATQLLAGIHYNAVSRINLDASPQTTLSQLSNAESSAVNAGSSLPMSTVNNITSPPMNCSGYTCYDLNSVDSYLLHSSAQSILRKQPGIAEFFHRLLCVRQEIEIPHLVLPAQ